MSRPPAPAPAPDRQELQQLIAEATAAFAAMPPEAQEAHMLAQAQSWVRGQTGHAVTLVSRLDRRIDELLETANRYLERARVAEAERDEARKALDETREDLRVQTWNVQRLSGLFDGPLPASDSLWINTPAGKAFYFDRPGPEMIDLDAIAHVLARVCRWGGNVLPVEGYDIAQHSLHVARLCEHPASRVYALLHDAPEAFVGDQMTPLKLWNIIQGADTRALERRILHAAIYPRFALPPPTAEIAADVDRADAIALATEFRDIVAGHTPGWIPPALPALPPIVPMPKAEVQPAYTAALRAAIEAAGGTV